MKWRRSVRSLRSALAWGHALGMSRSSNGKSRRLRLFKRREDDLLERSFRSCPACAHDVHVFADVCRHCGGSLEIALAG